MQQEQRKDEDEISLRELIGKTIEIWRYLIRRWIIILVIGLIGGGIGLTYALLTPMKYMSRVSFVVEESKQGMGGLAAIAGQFGFDVGGGASTGVFSGDNILLFLKSESLCRETLLTDYDEAGQETLADKYAEVNKLKSSWIKNKKIGQISFAKYKEGNFPRLEDSLIQIIIKKIIKKDLTVGKPDKKASFIEVKTLMRDELLSKYFSDRLVKIATARYVESKIKLKAINVAKLQNRADSLGAILNSRTYSAAARQQSLIDVNPALRMAPVSAEISVRDKTMVATIFAEVVKNLEIAKVALNQETPAIQMVDNSTLPLKKEKVRKSIAIAVGGFVAGLLCVLVLLFRKWWRSQPIQ
jgi:hypothetical protein